MNLKISIRGDKIVVTKAIKDYLHEKLERLNKYFKNSEDIKCNVIIRVKNNLQAVEVSIPTSKFNIRCEEGSDNLYASIDKDIDILEGQIRKMKTKKDKQNMTESIRGKEELRQEEEKEIEGEIVKTLYYDIKPLTPEDAKLKLEEKPQDRFLTFINIETGKVNVIYRMKDNKNYGLVEPEA